MLKSSRGVSVGSWDRFAALRRQMLECDDFTWRSGSKSDLDDLDDFSRSTPFCVSHKNGRISQIGLRRWRQWARYRGCNKKRNI